MDTETRDAIREARKKYMRAMGFYQYKLWLSSIGMKLSDQEFIDRAENAKEEAAKWLEAQK